MAQRDSRSARRYRRRVRERLVDRVFNRRTRKRDDRSANHIAALSVYYNLDKICSGSRMIMQHNDVSDSRYQPNSGPKCLDSTLHDREIRAETSTPVTASTANSKLFLDALVNLSTASGRTLEIRIAEAA